MDTPEAQVEAILFLEEFPADSFPTTEAMVAGAILWGERLGIQRMQRLVQAMDDAQQDVIA